MKIRRPTLGECFVDDYEKQKQRRSRLIFMTRTFSLTDEERFYLLSQVQDAEYTMDMDAMFAADHGKKIK